MSTMLSQPESLAAFRRLCPGEARSLENPSTSLADPANWLVDGISGEQSASGVRVSPSNALGYAPWWRGINLVSSDVAKLPLFVYRRVGDGKERDPKHQAYNLLRYKSNDELMSAFVWKQTLQAHAMSFGNGYSWIRRSGDARPHELIVLNPADVLPFREDGRLWYGVRVDGVWRRVAPTDIFHIKGLSPDGLVGYAVYAKARDSIGEGKAAQVYGSRFFRNSARPSVVIEVPASMGDDAQKDFRQQWERMNTGLDNAHRTAILTNGAKVNPFSATAKDSQLHESRKFNLVDIANFIGVPVHKVGGEGRTAYGSLEQENQAYLDESLDPWLCRWEDECREKLLTEEQKNQDTHVVEFLRQALVRADIVARYTAHNIAVRGGWESRDEVRSSENKAPLPGGEGKKFFAPLELQVIGDNKPPEVDDLPSLLSITESVVSGAIPPETAKAMLAASFPMLSPQQIDDIIDPLDGWEKPAPEPPSMPVAPTEPLDSPTEDEPQPSVPSQDIARRLIVDAMRRACNHLTIHAVKRAKRSSNFLDAIDSERSEDEERVSEIVDAPVQLCVSIGGTPCDALFIARMALNEAKTVLLTASEKTHCNDSRDDLVAYVETAMTQLSETLPDAVADYLLIKGDPDGTSIPAD